MSGQNISFTQGGKYDIQFSSQLKNTSNGTRVVCIWLSKNGTAPANWVAHTATDVTIGAAAAEDEKVAAWNFFVDVVPGDTYTLMIASSGIGMQIFSGAGVITNPAGIPAIPGTIVTVNQID